MKTNTNFLFYRNKAILDYLKSSNLPQTTEIFQKETGEIEELDPKKTGLLEKKWTSVIRLQKKVMDLETKIQQLQDELGSGNRNARNKNSGDNFPRAPELHTLSGHRDNIVAVKFHPVFNIIVSASQGSFYFTFSLIHDRCNCESLGL